MKTLPLTQGKVALVDDADYDALSQRKWTYLPNGRSGYAVRWIKQRTVYMHRQLLEAPVGLSVDHVNGDGLDNRRVNLRLATTSQNFANRIKLPVRSVPYRGAYWKQRHGVYEAQIKVNGKIIYLGRFSNPEDAARAYDKAAREHFGQFARLNFPDEE